jgi:hypothetical protein
MTHDVPFKDCFTQTDKMLKTTLRFLRQGSGADDDDIINIYSTNTSLDLFRVVYTPGDSSSGIRYESQMTRSSVLDYVSDILKGMRYDVDPFDRIQLSTDLHPSIMYCVEDMENVVTRRNIENMLYTSLRCRVVRL